MTYPLTNLAWLALGWGLYFGLHSLLASLAAKNWAARRHPKWLRGYRLFYNAVALVLLVPLLALMARWQGPWLWQWRGLGWWIGNGLALLAGVGVVWSLRYYDGSEFLGLRQWRLGVGDVQDQERFQISPLHRFVRHPWYSLGLVLLWTRDMDPALLTSAVLTTLYIGVGSRLEERKLIVFHGEIYRRYRGRVPALIPSPWRYLTGEEAEALLRHDREI